MLLRSFFINLCFFLKTLSAREGLRRGVGSQRGSNVRFSLVNKKVLGPVNLQHIKHLQSAPGSDRPTYNGRSYLPFWIYYNKECQAFSPVVRTGSLHPFTFRGVLLLPPLGPRAGHIARGGGGARGGPNSDEGTDDLVLYVFIITLYSKC